MSALKDFSALAIELWEALAVKTQIVTSEIAQLKWKDVESFLNTSCNTVAVKLFHLIHAVQQRLGEVSVVAFFLSLVIIWIFAVIVWLLYDSKSRNSCEDDSSKEVECCVTCNSMFDLAKTAYEDGHTEEVMSRLEHWSYDINYSEPKLGLTLLLCACLSGEKKLIIHLLQKGADINACTKERDSALYLATFGLLNSPRADINVLHELMRRGCNVNQQNCKGFTPLHRAATRGNIEVIKCLLYYGADPEIKTRSGIYPIDSATNAGYIEAAELLKIDIGDNNNNNSVSDIVEPYTPKHIRLGLQSPHRDQELMEKLAGSSLHRRPLKREILLNED